MNPTQLATTPTAEYELMNMRGRNSYREPKSSEWPREQYAISGMAMAM